MKNFIKVEGRPLTKFKFDLKMKLTALFLIITFFSMQANSTYAQKTKISLNLNDVNIQKVLDDIESITDFKFFVNVNEVNVDEQITIKAKNETIRKILKKIFKNQDIGFKIVGKQIVLGTKKDVIPNIGAIDDQQQISGTISDKNGQPLPGASIIEKGTTNGTQSDFDGNFSIEVAGENATLVISYIGFATKEIVIGNQTNLSITLQEDTEGLEEVVVVAYGTQKKSNLTAAVDQISGVVIQNRPLRSIADGLDGMVAGLNVTTPSGAPEATPNLNIRGFTGFGTSAQPLILVDGVERSISDINPNDVESISVLKDGAASAIYGSRAPFGVVLITTKKGKKGEDVRISYSSNYRFGSPTNTPKYLESYEFARVMNEANRNHPGGGRPAIFGELQISRMEAWDAGDFGNSVFDGLNPEEVPFGTYEQTPTQWGGHWQSFANTKWLSDALKSIVPSQEQNLSISGGGDKTSYYVGLGYNESTGIFKKINDFKNRYSALVSINTEVNNWLSMDFRVNYVKTDEKGPNVQGQGRNYGTIWNLLSRSFPTWPTNSPNGSHYRFSNLPSFTGEGGVENVSRNDITLTGGIKIEPVKDWKIEGRYTRRTNINNFEQTTFVLKQILPNGNEVNTQRTDNISSIVRRASNTDYYTFDLTTSYAKTLNDVHNFYALIGFQQENNDFFRLIGESTNFFSNSVPTLSTSADGFKASDQLYSWATRGYFGRFSYNFAEKYFIEFNVRRDATSRFKTDSRWGTFPSVAGSWNVSKENFWPLKKYVNTFKLRGSWSTSGNANVDVNDNNRIDPEEYYLFSPTINTGISTSTILNGQFVSFANQPGLVSNQLTWAEPTTIDVGLNIAAFKNRLEIDYDWYQRTVENQFGPAKPLPEVLGTRVPKSNNATSETRGWELTMKWRDKAFEINAKPFNYSLQFRMSDYIGYVVDYEDNGTGARGGQWTAGEVFEQNYWYESNGIMQNAAALQNNVTQGGTWYYPGDLALRDRNGDGQINTGEGGVWYAQGDRVKHGFNYPRKKYSIGLGADWNGLDLHIQLDGVGQWDTYSTSQYVWGNSGSKWFAPYFKESVDLGYWRPDNTGAFLPRNSFSGKNRSRANDQYALDLSHLRIKNIKLGYSFPKSVLEKVKVSNLYLYASAENLGFIYYNSFVKFDPQLLSASSGQGYPPQRVISLGLNVEL